MCVDMDKKTRILVSNDDGYLAKGINSLVEVLREFGDVDVFAPHKGRSGQGCAITSEQPIMYSCVSSTQGVEIYSCTLEHRAVLWMSNDHLGHDSIKLRHEVAYKFRIGTLNDCHQIITLSLRTTVRR